MRKLVTRLVLVLVLTAAVTVPAAAYTLPDPSTSGSLTIVMEAEGQSVAGGKVTIYKAGEIDSRARSYIFKPTAEFMGSKVSLSDIGSYEVAQQLAEYAKENSIAGISKSIGTSGVVCFEDLDPGLYMVVQDAAAEGYEAAKPFLIAVPELGEDGLDYNPEAFPKVVMISWGSGGEITEDEEKNDVTTEKKETVENTETIFDRFLEGTAELKDEGELPQTGQLKWPVPVLTILGLVLFAAGWYLRNTGRKGSYEK